MSARMKNGGVFARSKSHPPKIRPGQEGEARDALVPGGRVVARPRSGPSAATDCQAGTFFPSIRRIVGRRLEAAQSRRYELIRGW